MCGTTPSTGTAVTPRGGRYGGKRVRYWFDEPPEPAPFVRAIDRQPRTTPIPGQPEATDRCPVHLRALSYREGQAGACSWCCPELFEARP